MHSEDIQSIHFAQAPEKEQRGLKKIFGVVRDKEREGEQEREREQNSRRSIQWEMSRLIEHTTSTNVEDWPMVMLIRDKVNLSDSEAKEASKALRKDIRLGRPAVQLSAAKLWVILVQNRAYYFIVHTANRKFLEKIEEVALNPITPPVVRDRLVEAIGTSVYLLKDSRHLQPYQATWKKLRAQLKLNDPVEGFEISPSDPILNPTPLRLPLPGSHLQPNNLIQPAVVSNVTAVETEPEHVTEQSTKDREQEQRREGVQNVERTFGLVGPEEDTRRLFEDFGRFGAGFTSTEGVTKPTSSQESAPISKKTDAREVVLRLVDHGCKDLTGELDLSSFGENPVAHGGFSDIYRGLLLDGTRVAAKALRISVESISRDSKHLKRAARELHTWSKCRHPNVIPLLGLAIFRGRIGMVAPWMAHGNLPRYLEDTPGADRFKMCIQICEGLAYLHQIRIIHCDLKGANVLVSDEGFPVLTDFGNSSLVDRTLGFTQTTGTPSFTVRWSAAEIFEENASHTEASDVYALGMTIYETMAGKIPYKGKNDTVVFILVAVKKEFPEQLQAMPNDGGRTDMLWKLLTRCWSLEPAARPSAAEVAEAMRAIVSNTEVPTLRPTPIHHQNDSVVEESNGERGRFPS
ncbi:unnamed protein product [Rhizoctonia solani]|uniref:Protein kinase domain-containing protein n=1 Tax=Rhizoctonia solani TaxID=456999 RepID=A0A8H3HBU6_9AGAM|nr:unnamed protein product [Rhizoctonia solani]